MPGGGRLLYRQFHFAYFPGLPIFHSSDLVNWKEIGHALDSPEQLKLASKAHFLKTSYRDISQQ